MARIRHWAWGFAQLIAVGVACFTGWDWRYEPDLPKIFLTVQSALIALILVVIIRKRRAFSANEADLMIVAAAIMIRILVIFLQAKYFPTNQVQWAIDPPFYFRTLVYSNSQRPQENSLSLLIVSYLALGWLFRKTNKRSNPA
jgi:hypothetical protein